MKSEKQDLNAKIRIRKSNEQGRIESKALHTPNAGRNGGSHPKPPTAVISVVSLIVCMILYDHHRDHTISHVHIDI